MAASLWTDPALESEVVLDAIVALADVRHLPRQLAGGSKEVARQLAYADMVLLNKVGLEEGWWWRVNKRKQNAYLCA